MNHQFTAPVWHSKWCGVVLWLTSWKTIPTQILPTHSRTQLSRHVTPPVSSAHFSDVSQPWHWANHLLCSCRRVVWPYSNSHQTNTVWCVCVLENQWHDAACSIPQLPGNGLLALIMQSKCYIIPLLTLIPRGMMTMNVHSKIIVWSGWFFHERKHF